MRKSFTLILLVLAAVSATAAPATPDRKKMPRIVETALDFSLKQSMLMYDVVKDMPGALPNTTKDGELVTSKSSGWTAGFFPGTLWYLYENTGREDVRAAAEVMTDRMAPEQYNKNSHDVGFMINCSYGNGFRLTGKEEYRKALINAGYSLSTRFNPAVGCTRSWKSRPKQGWDFIVIIDNMMNLELLTVASALTGDPACYEIAKTHANTTMRNHFRPDYSTFHVVNYSEKDGRIIGRQTAQGLADDSSWARGQAWGLYGYTMMYRQTGDSRYLDQAVHIGQYLMNHPKLPKDKVPYWDYNAPASKTTPRDASAAAIMASAYIELSQFVEDGALSAKFLRLAEQILTSLSGKAYTAKLGKNANYVLMHSTAHFPKGMFDTPLVYADYYYVEALMRYKRLLQGRPVVDACSVVTSNRDRQVWITNLDRIARPLLGNLAAGTLKKNMPVESNNSDLKKRFEVTHLEGLGRTIVGISPWLELGPDGTPEGRLRAEYIDLACKAITNAVDPESPDHLNFNVGRQPLVDAAFLAHGLLRAPTQLWGRLDQVTRARLAEELKSSRVIKPSETNWLFFTAMVEAALLEFTGECDMDRINYAFDRFKKDWYKGDGWYGDGAALHIDYYNSFVIQPMMMTVLDVLKKHGITVDLDGKDFMDIEKERYSRYAEIQERLVSPEGTYPVVGRSLCYRFGAFQALSDVCYRHLLPATMDPAQARCAITAVMSRQMGAPGTFDEGGWLRPGFAGHQPNIGERYISTGSLYLVCAGFIALGLPESDPFWSNPAADWTSKKVWMGTDVPADHAIKN